MKTTLHLDQNLHAIAAQVIADGITMNIIETQTTKTRPQGITSAVLPSNLKEFENESIRLKVMKNNIPNKI